MERWGVGGDDAQPWHFEEIKMVTAVQNHLSVYGLFSHDGQPSCMNVQFLLISMTP